MVSVPHTHAHSRPPVHLTRIFAYSTSRTHTSLCISRQRIRISTVHPFLPAISFFSHSCAPAHISHLTSALQLPLIHHYALTHLTTRFSPSFPPNRNAPHPLQSARCLLVLVAQIPILFQAFVITRSNSHRQYADSAYGARALCSESNRTPRQRRPSEGNAPVHFVQHHPNEKRSARASNSCPTRLLSDISASYLWQSRDLSAILLASLAVASAVVPRATRPFRSELASPKSSILACAALRDEDVRRLDVAVDDSFACARHPGRRRSE